MRLIVLLVFCSWPMIAHAQITFGDAVPASDIAQAKATLAKATSKTLALQAGEFEVIEPAKGVTAPLLWIVSNEVALQRIEIAAQQPLGIWMKRRGDALPKLHQFPARPIAWVILVGVQQGTATVQIIRNGENNTAPVVVDTLVVSVGGPAPVPPTPPVEDDLTKSLRVALQDDQQAGKAEKKWLQALAGIYATASRDSLVTINNASDLDHVLISARQAAGIPAPEQMLPTLRQRLRQELLTQLNVTDQTANRPFTAEAKRIARQTLTHIAQALEAINQ